MINVTIGRYLLFLGKRLLLVLIAALTVFVVEFAFVMFSADVYRSTASISVDSLDVNQTRLLGVVVQSLVQQGGHDASFEFDTNLASAKVRVRCEASTADAAVKRSNDFIKDARVEFSRKYPDISTTPHKANLSKVVNATLKDRMAECLPASIVCAIAVGIAVATAWRVRRSAQHKGSVKA